MQHRLLTFAARTAVACAVIAAFSVISSGCAAALLGGAISASQASRDRAREEAKKGPELTQLQMRELQTREWDITDKEKILSVSVAVLSDDGYVIQNANTDLGLLSASKELYEREVDDSGSAFLKGALGGNYSAETSSRTIEVNITVVPFGEQTRVRMVARLSEVSTSTGVTKKIITDAEFYQNFFTKIEKGLFIEREGL